MKTSRKGFWRALEWLPNGAVMAEWSRELGRDAPAARLFLRPGTGLAETFPCTNAAGCGCPHLVEKPSRGAWQAVCDPNESCGPIAVTREDLVPFELDAKALCAGIARALGLSAVSGGAIAGVRAERVGGYGPAKSGVFLMFPGDPARMMREVERLLDRHGDPFVVMTATGIHCSADVESALRRQSCMHMALDDALVLGADGTIGAAVGAAALLAEFDRRMASGAGLVRTVEQIGRDIGAVAQGKYELEKEVGELRRMQVEGCFQFALRVEGNDFLAFACIMALGNRNAAARHLRIPQRSFYDRIESWKNGGPEQRRMFRMVVWRKAVGRKIKLRLEDSLQSGEPSNAAENPETIREVLASVGGGDNRDYATVLRQILEALQEQNAGNWADVRDELVEMVKEEVGGGQ